MVDRTTEREELCFGNTSQHDSTVIHLLSFVGVWWRVKEADEGGRNHIYTHIWIRRGHDGRNDL